MLSQKRHTNVAQTDDSRQIRHQGVQTRTITEQSSNHTAVDKTDKVAEEVPIAFTYNGQSHAVMMASPIDLYDFAVGFSITERIVDSIEQIRDIEIREAKQGFTVQLAIDQELMRRLAQQKRQMSGRSGCGVCGISDLAAAIPQLTPLEPRTKPNHDVISKALDTFQHEQALQQECGATHCAALFDTRGALLELREDIGRHNALDKLIGARLSNRQKGFNDGDFLILSSRASHELITKAVIARVSNLVCISAATSLAIDMSEELNLNLIGFVRGQRQLIYHQNQFF